MDEKEKIQVYFLIFSLLIVIIIGFLSVMFVSCTISFQNVSTHGMAEDIVDETQDAKADISPDIMLTLSTI